MPCVTTLSVSIPTLSVHLPWARGLWKTVSSILLYVPFPFKIFNDLGDIFQICKEMIHAELPFLFVRFKRHIINKVWLSFWLCLRLATEIPLLAANKHNVQLHTYEKHSHYYSSVHPGACVFCEPNEEHVQRAAAGVCQSLQDLTQILPEIPASASTVGNVTTMLHYKVKDFISPLNFCV